MSTGKTGSSKAGVAVRVAAAQVLSDVVDRGVSRKPALAKHHEVLSLAADRALLEHIVFDALRWKPRFEAMFQPLLREPLKTRDRVIHWLLVSACVQLGLLEQPAYAVIDASVEAARVLKCPKLAGLVNAVLRKASVSAPEQWQATAELAPDVAWAHPMWLVEQLRQDWSEQADDVLAANNQAAAMMLRTNLRRTTRAQLLERLAEQGIQAEADALTEAGIVLTTQAPHPSQLPGFLEGDCSVQDGAALQAAMLMGVKDGDRVLDLCAAPGGKTAAMLERFDCHVTAIDIDPVRVTRMQQTLERLHLSAEFGTLDASQPEALKPLGLFDRILLDAPCSGTGVIRRQPDIKWHRRAKDVTKLKFVQSQLLLQAWTALKPGGTLCYGTCSVLREENDQVLRYFHSKHPEAMLLDPGEAYGWRTEFGRQRLPGEHGRDGFYYALISKPAE